MANPGITDQQGLFWIASGDHGPGLGVEEDRTVADTENAGQFVGDDDDGGAEILTQFENQFVKMSGGAEDRGRKRVRR